jgi:hypothetical protein
LGEYAKILTDELGTMVGPDGKPIPARKDDYERTVAELADVRDKQRALLGVSVTAGGEEEITDVPQP